MSGVPNKNPFLSPNQEIEFNFYDPSTSSRVTLSPRSDPRSALNQPSINPLPNPGHLHSNLSNSSDSDSEPQNNSVKTYEDDIKKFEEFLQYFESNNQQNIQKKEKFNKELQALMKFMESATNEKNSLKNEIFLLESKKKDLENEIAFKENLTVQMKNDVESLEAEKEKSKVFFEPLNRMKLDYDMLEKNLTQKSEYYESKIRELRSKQDQEIRDVKQRYENELKRVTKKQREMVRAIKGKEEQLKNHKSRIAFQKWFKKSEDTETPKPIPVSVKQPKLEFKVQQPHRFSLSIENICLISGVVFGIILKFWI